MPEVILVAHNLRSSHNVGSLLRTAECLGVSKVFLSGYTPYPELIDDERLPHVARKVSSQIEKTALGAQDLIEWEKSKDISGVFKLIKNKGYKLVALEQTPNSVDITSYQPAEKTAIVVGREVEGLEQEVLELCDEFVEIPMKGKKESLNVCQAAAIAMYHCKNYQNLMN